MSHGHSWLLQVGAPGITYENFSCVWSVRKDMSYQAVGYYNQISSIECQTEISLVYAFFVYVYKNTVDM